MNDIPEWDEYFINIVKVCRTRSKDPNTKIGCVIVGPEGGREIRSTGYNSFPRHIDDHNPKRLERPEKYKWIEHAERNAIYNAARCGIPLRGCTMYISQYPCTDCARAIIQSGICELVVSTADEYFIKDRWSEDMDKAIEMLKEAGVTVRSYP